VVCGRDYQGQQGNGSAWGVGEQSGDGADYLLSGIPAGSVAFGFCAAQAQINPEELEDMFEETLSFYRLITEFHTSVFWKEVSAALMNIGLEITIGGVIIGFIASQVTYRLSLRAVEYYRQRKHLKRERRHRTTTI
jgi:hypothetical protein